MKIKEYAFVDNLYSCYVEYRWIFKHIFTPNATSGKNSATKIRSENRLKTPPRWNALRDQTKNELYIKKETI